jgi:hypothetical protein
VSANTLENICENMLTHMHKVIHLVVSIFEQGWRSWRSQGGVFPDAASDVGRASGQCIKGDVAPGFAPDSTKESDRTLAKHCSAFGPYDVACLELSQRGTDVETRPVSKIPLWMLTGLDLTLGYRGEQHVRSLGVGAGARASRRGTDASGPAQAPRPVIA